MNSSVPQPSQKESPTETPTPPVAMGGLSRLKAHLARTGTAFVAEYSMFLIALGICLSNLSWLFFVFFGLVVNGSAFVPTKLLVLWVIVSSAIALPVALGLWRRTQGELTQNKELKGELRGGARGFRTFWLVVNALVALSMSAAALFAPVAALVDGTNVVQALLAVTLPSLLSVALAAKGWYLVTRQAGRPGKSVMLLGVVAALTVLLFIVNFVWSLNAKQPDDTPYRTPTKPYMYNDPYYDYEYDY